MEIAHSVAIRVFCGEEGNESEIVNSLKSLLPFDLGKEKITTLNQDRAEELGETFECWRGNHNQDAKG